MKIKEVLFWQPRTDYLRWFEENILGKKILIILNYIIWLFFFYLSYLLIKKDTNIFWQILIATFIAEIIERFVKRKISWCRPMFKRKNKTPTGLIDGWYKTGSFPSGHTIKASYFLLFIHQYQIFSPAIFLLIVIPLLSFRVIVGFHYPIDMVGGLIIGAIVWLLSMWVIAPDLLNQIIKTIFDLVFFIQ
ncbi:MAG: phosphatase PAP2 family protein [Candidatus Shapirobacteria bacterium]|nr:phosphatase PAP2 family protein [Candidatus Shapirobacteria bacterium]